MHKIERLLQTLAPKGVEFRKIKDIATFRRGSFPQPYTEPKWYGGDNSMPFIQVIDFADTMQLNEKSKQSISKLAQPKSVFVPKGTIIVTLQGTIGKVAITQYDAYVDRTIAIFTSYLVNINKKFFAYTLHQKFEIEKEYARGSTLKTITKEEFSDFLIPIPPLEIQQEIVKILDAFTELNTELNTELKARKKQYQYYQNMLLDFNDIDQNHKDAKEKLTQKPYPKRLKTLLHTLVPKGVEFRKLGDIGEFTRGNGLLKSDLQDKGRPVVHYGQIHTQYNLSIDKTISYVNDALFHKLKKAKQNDILIVTTSENVKDVGKSIAWLGNEEVAFSGEMYSYSTNENPKFIIYYFQTWFFQKEKEKKITGTKVMRIHENDLKQITIPIPPLEVQQEIVKILDQFSALTTDLLAGIPAEIKARKKQYEYYREKLLTFKPLTPNKEVKK
ncbi:restriction endonuclease subunit S [Helicobacter pylori]|uniref:restriction endonuclease subunit S n=2 Tax=Helicobacter pylori TaxID=210 RepID=UPI000EB31B35|nr:restriction endonuclease subunit S [Helicobacter pylori]